MKTVKERVADLEKAVSRLTGEGDARPFTEILAELGKKAQELEIKEAQLESMEKDWCALIGIIRELAEIVEAQTDSSARPVTRKLKRLLEAKKKRNEEASAKKIPP